MPFITIKLRPKDYQISFDDIINGVNDSFFERCLQDTKDTRTVFREHTPKKLLENYKVEDLILRLEIFVSTYANLINVEDKSTLYRSFKIPKRSGGLRQIDAPEPELMTALTELKYIFERHLYASYHTAAFAYVAGRCTVDAVKRHQANNSKWFLKLDFHDFFGSSTPEFVMKQLGMIFPFNEILSSPRGEQALRKALSLCFLNGGLPQGTPISPTLTNIFMIPIDFAISKMARESTPHLCYTRYADDIIISSEFNFESYEIDRIMGNSKAKDMIEKNKNTKVYQLLIDGKVVAYKHDEKTARISSKKWGNKIKKNIEIRQIHINDGNRGKTLGQISNFLNADVEKTKVLSQVINILNTFDAPFTLSYHKTRYGSRAGSNYNLGVILNNDNKITIGHAKKKVFKTMIHSFMTDSMTDHPWKTDEVQHLYGLVSYYRMVEGRETIDTILKSYSEKFNKDVEGAIKDALHAM